MKNISQISRCGMFFCCASLAERFLYIRKELS